MKRIIFAAFLLFAGSVLAFADTVVVDSFSYFNEAVADTTTPRTIELSSSIVADSSFNYQGAADLTVSGNGFFLDGGGFGPFVSSGTGMSVTFSSITLLNFQNYAASDSTDSFALGGALYTDSTANISTAAFTNNTATAYSSSGTAYALGGAIYNAGTTTITNSYFAFNAAVSSGSGAIAQGGAIYNADGAVLNIFADGANTIFEGNTANGQSNAIYNSSTAAIYLNAVAGSSIVFNDAITGNAQAGYHGSIYINSALPYSGDIVLNNALTANDIYLYSGTLKVGIFGGVTGSTETNTYSIPGSRGSIGANDAGSRGYLYMGNGSVLDMANGVAGDVLYFSSITVEGTAKVNIDVDLASVQGGYVRNLDMIDIPVADNASGSGTLDFTGMRIISDFTSGVTANIQVFKYNTDVNFLAGQPDFYTNNGSATYLVTNVSTVMFNITLESYSADVFQDFVSSMTGLRVFWSTSSYNTLYTAALYDATVASGTLVINGGLDASSNTIAINGANVNRLFNINSEYVNLQLNNINVINGLSESGSAVLNSSGVFQASSVLFQNNVARSTEAIPFVGGGAIYNSSYSYVVNSTFTTNSAAGVSLGTVTVSAFGGAVYNDTGAVMTIENTSFNGNSVSGTGSLGGAIYNAGVLNIVSNGSNSTFSGNTASGVSNAINNAGGAVLNLNAGASDIIFKDRITSSGDGNVININGDVTYSVYSDVNIATVSAPTTGRVVIAADMSGFGNINGATGNQVNLYGGTLVLSQGGVLFTNAQFDMYAGSRLDLQNGTFDDVKIPDFNLVGSGNAYVSMDVNLASGQSDNFLGSVLVSSGATLVIDKIHILKDAGNLANTINLLIADDGSMQQSISLDSGAQKIMGPIFAYDVSYANGILSFAYTNDFNPAVFIVPVTMYVGGYLEQMNTYAQVFDAAAGRTMEKSSQGLWVRPYGYKEDVKLYNKLTVTHETYGAFAGYDTDSSEISNLNLAFSIFGGLNASTQKYDGANIDQSGGLIGASAVLYGEQFWTAFTANIGVINESGVDTNSGDTQNFMMYSKGLASETGYNIPLDFDNKFRLVPSLMLAMSFIDMAPFKQGQDVTVTSDSGLYPFTLQPSVKFLADVSDDLSAYANVSFVYSIFNDANFKANDVVLPEFSIDPYLQYGVGFVKKFGSAVSSKAEVFGLSGGRNGFGGSINVQLKFGTGSADSDENN